MASRVRATAVGGLMALALAGCGAGQSAATSQDLPSVPGYNTQDAGVAVRNAAITFTEDGYDRGEDAPITLAVFNDTDEPVALTGASSGAAGSVTVQGDDLEVPPFGYVHATLQVTRLGATVDATGSVPVVLDFDNGASLSLRVPMAPPAERDEEREPLDIDEAEH